MSAAAKPARKAARSWKHSDIGALVAEFSRSGIPGVMKAYPDLTQAELEDKLESLGVLKLQDSDLSTIAEFGEYARAADFPVLFARAAIKGLREIIAARVGSPE